MAKKKTGSFDIKSIGQGALIGEIRDFVVEFYHAGKMETVEISVKQLPFSKTEDLHRRLNENDKSVVSEWISLTLVGDDGKQLFTPEQIEENFTQSLAGAIFTQVTGIKELQEYAEKLGKESSSKMNSGQS